MTTSLLTLASLLALAFAHGSNGGPDVIYQAPISWVSNETARLFQSAMVNPNATRSIEFTPFEGQDLEDFEDTTWTWRVNISDFAVTSEPTVQNPGVPPDNAHMVSTAYDLSWPGGGNILAEVSGSSETRPFCVTGVVRQYYAANVTNAFTDDDRDSTSCEPALGEECIDAILRQEIATDDGCARPEDWVRIPECYSSFGYSVEESTGILRGRLETQNLTSYNGAEYASGGRFMAFATNTFDSESDAGKKIYANAARHLQVLMLQTTSGDSRASQLLCMRVDTEEIEDQSGVPSIHELLGSAWWMILGVAMFFIMA